MKRTKEVQPHDRTSLPTTWTRPDRPPRWTAAAAPYARHQAPEEEGEEVKRLLIAALLLAFGFIVGRIQF